MSFVTIILTTLNSERFVARSIESCLYQTHRDLELLVVDGGSQDRTLEIVGGYSDPRIRVIYQEDNAGKLPGAINLGMINARGDFLTWTQDDCWYEPSAIETMLTYLHDNPDVALVYADYWEVDEEGNSLHYQRVHSPRDILVDDVIRVCFLFRRQVYETVGLQETGYFPVHEVPWRIQVAERFQIRPLHIPLLNYIVHKGSLTGRIGGLQLRRMTAANLLDLGYLDERMYRRRLAEIDVNEAYEALVFRGDFSAFRRHAFSGLWQDWRWLLNLGLLKLLLMSFSPNRDELRSRWLLCQEGQHSEQQMPEAVEIASLQNKPKSFRRRD